MPNKCSMYILLDTFQTNSPIKCAQFVVDRLYLVIFMAENYKAMCIAEGMEISQSRMKVEFK